MLAFGLAALLGLLTMAILASVGSLGSCFEGSCGYAGVFVVFPIVTLIALLPIRKYVARFGSLSSMLAWTLVVLPFVAITLEGWGVIAVLGASALGGLRLCRNAKLRGQDLRSLFLHESMPPIKK
jgi:hypothetical protein